MIINNKYGNLCKFETKNANKLDQYNYVRKSNSKYLFTICETKKNNLYYKFKKEIDNILDSSKTGLNESDIEDIIFFHNSYNISAGEDNNLHRYCESKGINLKIWGLDEIANYIYNNH